MSIVDKILNEAFAFNEHIVNLVNFMYQREIGGEWITKILVGTPGNNITKTK